MVVLSNVFTLDLCRSTSKHEDSSPTPTGMLRVENISSISCSPCTSSSRRVDVPLSTNSFTDREATPPILHMLYSLPCDRPETQRNILKVSTIARTLMSILQFFHQLDRVHLVFKRFMSSNPGHRYLS